MGKIDDYFKGRDDGLRIAYNILQKAGIKCRELEGELKARGITDPKVYLNQAQWSRVMDKYQARCMEFSNCFSLLVMWKYFGFGEKRLQRIVKAWFTLSHEILDNTNGMHELYIRMCDETNFEHSFPLMFNDKFVEDEEARLKEHREQYEEVGSLEDLFQEWKENECVNL